MNEIERLKKKKQKEKIGNIIFIILFLIVIVMMIYAIFYHFTPSKIDESLIETYDLSKDIIRDPIQERLPESEIITKKMYGTELKIEKLASYDIIGKVEATKDYSESILASLLAMEKMGGSIINKISPRDLAVSWGKLALDENSDYFTADQQITNGYRMVMMYPEAELLERMSMGEIQKNFSNNHVIVLDNENRNTLMKVKVGDIVRIVGYLVFVETSDGFTWGPSSMIRTDSGCEILLAEQILIMNKVK